MTLDNDKTIKLAAGAERVQLVSITIKDKQALYMAYMPFVKNGGLFVPTQKEYELGVEVFLLVKIIDEIEPVHIPGKVVWINPARLGNDRSKGIGVQFSGSNAPAIVSLIESKLGASLSLTRSTHTM
jgi:type IV pilus assembly protein PilZ